MNKNLLIKLITGLFATVMFLANNSFADQVNVTGEHWNIIGADSDMWNNSTLQFESQVLNGEHYDVTGFFLWENNASTKFGKEVFEGTLLSDRTFTLDGHLVGETVGIASSQYTGVVSEDGSKITEGTWNGGTWSASRNVGQDDNCVASYTISGALNIPCVSVPDAFGGTIMYKVDMNLIPLSNPFSFELIKAQQIDGISINNNCFATYNTEGLLNIPCVSVPDAFGGTIMYQADMELIPFSSPFTFKLIEAQQK